MNFEVMALIMRKAFGSPTKKQVIQMMAAHINEVSETRVWPSATRLGLRCELHERTVRRTWDTLAEDGIIKAVGVKKLRGGEITVWNVNLKAIMALPDAIPSIEKELESEDELFAEEGDPLPDKLSGGRSGPPDTVSATTGHSVHDPRAQSPTNNSIELSSESSIPREARGSVDWTIEELWKAGPQSTRIKSSRKELAAAVKAALKKRGDVTGPALVEAYARYLKRADIHRDNGKYALGVHRWITQNRFDAFLAPGLLEAAKPGTTEVKDAARLERLDAAFWRYGRTREWHGPRDGWNLKPDMAPPGHYPPDLYTKYGLKPSTAPPADQTGSEAA